MLEFYDGFFNRHDPAAASVIAENYKQHNPQVPDGKAAFVDLLTANFAQNPTSRATVVRSAVDGDLVYLHVHSTNGPNDSGQAIVDIFRVDNGAIVEHWDVIQPVQQTAANSNTMF
ncbi:nuclear transport factor 2 family protein [Rhodococcus sp. NPDC019627]|uniref:nuclear transport factor 2 family protein n=1 Tax=unclassified Rhodococcus (in: high G+C Gram-positive bacteria) TaxID=192944 RepID=UPI0034057DE1